MPDWLPGGDRGSDEVDGSYELSNSFDMDSWLTSGQATDEDLIEEEPEAPAAGEIGAGEAAAGGFLAGESATGVADRVRDAPLMPILVVVAAVLVIGLLAVAGPWVDGYNVIGLDNPAGDGDGTGPANGTATATPTDTGTGTDTDTATSTATDADTSSPTSSPTATEASTPADTPTATEESTPAPTDSPTESPTETETPILPVETPGGDGTPTLPGGDGTPTLPGGDETSTATETETATPGPLDPILDPLPGLSLEIDDLTGSLF